MYIYIYIYTYIYIYRYIYIHIYLPLHGVVGDKHCLRWRRNLRLEAALDILQVRTQFFNRPENDNDNNNKGLSRLNTGSVWNLGSTRNESMYLHMCLCILVYGACVNCSSLVFLHHR